MDHRRATGIGFALVQLEVAIVNVALARIGAELGTGVTGLQWVVDAYALAFASLLRSAFLVNLPLGAAGISLTLRFVEESPASGGGFDLAGQALGTTTLVALPAAVIEAGARGWADPLVLSGIAPAVQAGSGFVVVEARVARPMLPPCLFRHPAFGVAALVGFAINLTLYGVIFVLSLYLQRARLLSPHWP